MNAAARTVTPSASCEKCRGAGQGARLGARVPRSRHSLQLNIAPVMRQRFETWRELTGIQVAA